MNRRLFALPLALVFAACGGEDPGTGPGPGPGPTETPAITSITPNPLLEGETATITGTDFSATEAANLVRIDGLQATVLAASATQLTVRVPATCSSVRTGDVTVAVNSRTSDPFSVEIDPDPEVVQLAVGEQAIFRDRDTYCVELPESDEEVQYLVGMQSILQSGTTKTTTRLTGTPAVAGAPALSAVVRARPASNTAGRLRELSPGAERLMRHRLEHATRIEQDLALLGSVGPATAPARSSSGGGGPAAVVVTGSESVGDRVQLRVRDHTIVGQNACEPYTEITAELRVKTARAMWFTDIENPEPTFTLAQLQEMAQIFEDDVIEADDDMFGAPGDQDNNGRTVIVITHAVNRNNGSQHATIGFVNPCDGWARGRFSNVEATNEGEFFYAISPDEQQTSGQQTTIDFMLEFMPILVAHEYAHVIQFSRRFAQGGDDAVFPATFEVEGQATLAEEIVGHAILGHQTGQNYGGDLAWDPDDNLPFPWYLNHFTDMAFWYGADPNGGSNVPGAPEQCTWTAGDSTDPDVCLSRPSWYGVTWSFLRWFSDQYADVLGGEDAVQKAIIDTQLAGFTNLQNAFGNVAPFGDLLAQWAASLYVDDRIPGNPNPRLTFPSWNLVSVEDASPDYGRLLPRERTFEAFTDNVTIRSPSVAYWLVTGTSGGMTLAGESATGNALPEHIQMWIVRMK